MRNPLGREFFRGFSAWSGLIGQFFSRPGKAFQQIILNGRKCVWSIIPRWSCRSHHIPLWLLLSVFTSKLQRVSGEPSGGFPRMTLRHVGDWARTGGAPGARRLCTTRGQRPDLGVGAGTGLFGGDWRLLVTVMRFATVQERPPVGEVRALPGDAGRKRISNMR